MAAITAAQRSQAYLLIACLAFLFLICLVVGCAVPAWSYDDNAANSTTITTPEGSAIALSTDKHTIGLWRACYLNSVGNAAVGQLPYSAYCKTFQRTDQCNGWYQMARVSSIIAICFTFVFLVVAIACAMQSIITKLLPAILVCLGFCAWFFTMMTWISWLVMRGHNCVSRTEALMMLGSGSDLGASFVLYIFAFVFLFLCWCLAIFLLLADILVPASGAPEMKDNPAYAASGYPAPTSTPVYY